jgi:hypothetical protein
MKTHPDLGETMQFAGIDNQFGTDAFAAPTVVKIRPHRLPKTKKGVRVHRAPNPLSATIKNFLLNYNG